MNLKCGIVGLPNVGKSTMFNAVTASSAPAENYPFCTIEPNVGIVAVPDDRLNALATVAGSAKIIPAYIEFVDIAGLVKGASKGEGLGNQFLAHIRSVDAIIHVLRCFEDHNVTHVHGKVDPIYDADIIETELMISDLEMVERRIARIEKIVKGGDKTQQSLLETLQILHKGLSDGQPVRTFANNLNQNILSSLDLITNKPILYLCNVDENSVHDGNKFSQLVAEKAKKENAAVVIISSKIESEIALLTTEEKVEFLSDLGLAETGLNKVIKAAYKLLGLHCFFTVGPKEAHAWIYAQGTLAPQAAGIIHTDFERGFIRAEVISFEDYIKYSGESGARTAGKTRLEGKDYPMTDGDVVHFRFNV